MRTAATATCSGERAWQEENVSSADLASLTPTGRHAYNFLANRDPARVPELVEQLPPAFLDDMRALSPSLRLDSVNC